MRAIERRRQERIEYRMPDIAVVVQHPGGGAGKFLVHARNISAGGMAFIHGGYVHPGSECRVALTRRDGRRLAVAGVIAHCRHVDGPHHEVGIRFLKEIDPEDVLPPVVEDDAAGEAGDGLPALEGHVLIVDKSPCERRLLKRCLCGTGLELTDVETTGAALDEMRRHTFQLVLCDVSLDGDAAARMIKQMRDMDFKGPIILVTAENDIARLTTAREAGANEIIGKPYTADYIVALVAEWLESPAAGRTVYSTLEERAGMAELIADFVDEAQRLAHQMEKAISDGAFSRVRDLTLRLAGSGAGFGFEAVTKAARDALTALDTSRSVAASSGPLRRLIDLCHRLGCSRAARPIRT
jgi:CheY-like chemotaxis protein